MAGWSSLPPEIKQHVVKRLDFMSRHSLRHTSRLDRQIVDSTKCQVPRVRFGYKEGRGLIVVYTGIDQFLRIEMQNLKNDCFEITKYDSSLDLESSIKVRKNQYGYEIRLKDEVLLFKMFCLTDFLFHGVKFRVLELDIPKMEGNGMVPKILEAILISLSNHCKEFAFSGFIDGRFCSENILKEKMLRHFRLAVSDEGLVPIKIHEGFVDRPERPNIAVLYAMRHGIFDDGAVAEHSDLVVYFKQNLKGSVLHEPRRECIGNAVRWTKTTKCGRFIQTVNAKQEEYFMDKIKSTECGLGDLCKRCSDPFDYWYTQNLPRRLYFEPFWDTFANRNDEEMIRKLRLKIAADEETKEKKKGGVASWGFGRQDNDWDLFVQINSARRIEEVFDAAREAAALEIEKEENEEEEDDEIGKQLLRECEEMEKRGKWLLDILIFYLLPIITAIAAYLFYYFFL